MKWLIEELESQISMYGLVDDAKKVNELKRAIVVLEKNNNVFWFPKVMNFFPISHDSAAQLIMSGNQPKVGEEIFAIFQDKTSTSIQSSSGPQGRQGNQGFQGKMGQCLYTWKEENNPEEIIAYAGGMGEKFSAGQKWMPCRKNKSEKFLVICTNDCCRQPE